MANAVSWFEIYVRDMERAIRFYETVLDVKLQKLDTPLPGLEMWAFNGDRDAYGIGGSLVRMDQFLSLGNSTIVYFESSDCAVPLARVIPAGGTIIRPKVAIGPFGFIALAQDTEGNVIGLHSM